LTKAFPIVGHKEICAIEVDSDAACPSKEFGRNTVKSVFQNWGAFDGSKVFTGKIASKASNQGALRDVLEPENQIPDAFWVEDSEVAQGQFLKGPKALERTTSDGFSYKYSERQMAFPDDLDKTSRTILTGEGGRTPSRFKHVTKVGKRLRRLTPVELERLNGSPDDWTKFSHEGTELSDSRRAFLMGNAVVIGAVEKIEKVLLKEFF
jgi:DNA (cytosine-5)-methyltransferase 1